MAEDRTMNALYRNKLFGLGLLGMTPAHGGVGAGAQELRGVMETPASPDCWQAVQKRARENTQKYEDVFDWIPRNYRAGSRDKDEASLWPRWKYDKPGERTGGELKGAMPFQTDFWQADQDTEDRLPQLEQVRGFVCELPLKWTKLENNNWGYHAALISAVEPDDEGEVTV